MSDTPETDAHTIRRYTPNGKCDLFVPAPICQRMEKENHKLRTLLQMWAEAYFCPVAPLGHMENAFKLTDELLNRKNNE